VERAAQTAASGKGLASRAGRYDLRHPLSVFLVVFGVAKLAELIDWPRLHGDAAAMLGVGSGTATTLLIAGKSTELLLTAVAALGLVRRSGVWPLAALAGWTLDLALLTVVAGIGGDLGRLLEHGLFFVAFAGLLAMAYARGALLGTARTTGGPTPAPRSAPPAPQPPPAPAEESDGEQHASSEPTRQDLPVRRRGDVTRQDLPVRRSDVTRRDLPVRKRSTAAPDPVAGSDDATHPDPAG
jgi:hypothetical protein